MQRIGEPVKKFAVLAAILIGLIAVFVLLLSTPTAYIYGETGFLCAFMPRRLYDCDAIGYGGGITIRCTFSCSIPWTRAA